MGLRSQAHTDLIGIVESSEDFGWPIVVVAPGGQELSLTGLHTDHGLTFDLETGLPISGRRAAVALVLQRFTDAGLPEPRAVIDAAGRPWVVRATDIHGTSHLYKIVETMPDRTIGMVTCVLEVYVDAA